MTTVVVTGIGLVCALGPDRLTVWQRLLAGESAIALRQPFPALPPLPLSMIGKAPASVDGLLDQAVSEALADAQLTEPGPLVGVVVGSSRAYQGQLEQLAQQWRSGQDMSAADWLRSQPHQISARLARRLQITGPVLAPMAACATGLWAIAQGCQLIQSGQCDQVIVGAVEAPITPLALAGFERMGALAQTGCYPFDTDREGLVPGEGVAVLVLETLERAGNKRRYGQVLGVGLTNDAHHVSSPMPGYGGAIAAIRQGLQRSQRRPDDIDYIHAHGTATRLNDQMEATVFNALFPHRPAVSSTKGATGHTLGASGALGMAVCLMGLAQQQLPPNVGMRAPAFDLNLVRQGMAANIETALCCSFGFGGQNAAVVVGR